MSCRILRKDNGQIDKVLAPNGNDSILYQDMVKLAKENITQFSNDPYVQNSLSKGLIKNTSPEEVALAAWSKVYNKSFKDWFGDSKAVDVNNEPLMVYHFSKSDFDTFNTPSKSGDYGPMLYFVPKKNSEVWSYKGANKMPLFLKVENPYIDPLDRDNKPIDQPTNEYAKNKGNDGIIDYYNQTQFTPENALQIAVYDRNQAKSIFNQGEFSIENDNIYYQLDGLNKEDSIKLENKVLKFVSNFGVQAKDINELKKHADIDSLGVIDILNKIIYYSDNSTDTLTEGASLLTMIMMGKDNPDVQNLINNEVKNWDKYEQVKQELSQRYSNEQTIDFIASAKLVSEKLKELDANKKELTALEKILKAIKDFITKNFRKYKDSKHTISAENIASAIINYDISSIDTSIPENFKAVDADQALANNEFAKTLNDKILKLGPVLTGSLAVSKTSKIYRDVNEQIHDLDYVVKSKDDIFNVITKLHDNNKKSTFTHNGIVSEYSECYTLMFLKDKYEFAEISRYKSGWRAGNINMRTIVKNIETGVYYRLHEDMYITADFFVDPSVEINENYRTASFEHVFQGKQQLGKKHPYFFNRNKDLKDYVLAQNSEVTKSKDEFLVDLNPKTNQDILPELKNLVNSLGFKVEDLNTYIENYEIRTGKKWEGESVNALIDFANSTIATKKGKEASFNEEAAHLAIAMSPVSQGARFERALVQVVNTNLYSLHNQAYRDAYKKQNPNLTEEALERKVRIEVLGKVLLENLVNQKEAAQNYGNWLSRFLKNLWDTFISIFTDTSLDNFINEVSSKIRTGDTAYFSTTNNIDEGIYYDLDQDLEVLTQAQKLKKDILANKQLRLKKLKERGKLLDAEKLQSQIEEIEEAEAEIGLVNFINYLARDLKSARKSIQKLIDQGRVPTNDYIANITDFINFYKNPLLQLKNAMQYGDIILSDNRKENKALVKTINKILPIFEEVYGYNRRSNEKVLAEYVKDNIDDPDFNIEAIMQEPGNDINTLRQIFGTPRDIKDPFTRVIYNIIGQVFYKVKQLANTYGKQMIDKVFNDFNTKQTSHLAERNSEGKTTGYFLTRYKLDEFFKKLDEIKTKINEQTENEDDRKELLQEWLAQNTEQRYTQEYYDLLNTLSQEAINQRDLINGQINSILNKYKKQDLTVDLTEVSDEDWKEIKEKRIARKHLANLYDKFGIKKTGTALEIAKEFKEFYEKYFENVEFKPNMAKFNEAKSKVPANKLKKWIERNTELRYTKEFWDLFNQLAKKDYGVDYSNLQEERLELLRPFREDTQEIDMATLPDEIKDRVKEIDIALNSIILKLKEEDALPKKKEGTVRFKDIAEVVKTDEYLKAREEARKAGKIKEWIDANHYFDAYGEKKPYSYWTKFRPKNPAHIERLPTREWQELSEDSRWRNPNYDPTWAGYQPKASKYSNPEYNKLSDNDKKLLDYFYEEKHKADGQMGIAANYRLPQMSQSFMDLMYQRSNLLEGFKELAIESVSKRTDDEALYGNPDNEYRSDGTKVNYVSRKYTRMIEKPETISTDILSSMILYKEAAINHEEMSKIAPQVENVHELLGNRKFKSGKKLLPGKESNVYKLTRAFIDSQLYGINMAEGKDFTLFGIKMNTSKVTDTINSYVRNNNLIGNLYSILSNITGGAITASIDTVIGRYATKNTLAKATSEFMSNIGAVLLESKAANKKNKMNLVLDFFGAVSENDKQFDNLDKTNIARLTPEDLTYFGWNQGAYMIKAVPALAVLFNQRYDTQTNKFLTEAQFKKQYPDIKNHAAEYNKLTSIYDMLEVNRGGIVVKQEFKDKVSQEYLAKLAALVAQRVSQIDGAVTPLDRTIAHRHVWWKLVTTHRGWLIDGLARRWKGESKNLLTGFTEVGYHRYFFTDFMKKAFFTEDKKFKLMQVLQPEVWNTLEPHQKEAVYRTLLDMAIVMGMIVLAKAINNMADDDEELEWAAYLSNRVLMEVAALSPTPFMIAELTQIINSPVAGVRQIETLMDIMDIFNSDEIESGRYEGLSKRQRFLIKMIPGLKGFYGASDPQASNEYLKTKALRWVYVLLPLIMFIN